MPEHALKEVTICSARCACGWKFYNQHLKDKSDDELEIEAGREFEKHKAVFAGSKGNKI